MARKPNKIRADLGYEQDADSDPAPPVTQAQLRQLRRVGFKGAWPSTSYQAKQILARYRKEGANHA
jgi:hypothetical protein